MQLATRNLDQLFAASQHAGHRRPREAGSADRYYGRPYNPNFAINNVQIDQADMSQAELSEYDAGWFGETERKDWGSDYDADRYEDHEAVEA